MSANRFARSGLAFAVSALLIGVFLVQAAGPAAAGSRPSKFFVSPTAHAGNADLSCRSAAYQTIQSAVNAAPAWGSVVVCPGSYHEQVVLSRPVTMTGRQATIDETGVTPALVVSPPNVGPLKIFAAVAITSSHVQLSGFAVTHALGEGILAGGVTGTISHITVSNNLVTHNDLGGGIPPASTYFECQAFGQIPGDCGEGVHFLSVAHSSVIHNVISDNQGGVLLTDEDGPTHDNLVAYNTVTNNGGDCGITAPGHNTNALSATGKRQPSVAGVYRNTILGNVVTGNGLQGEGAGVLFANASAGTASYDNLVVGNYLAGNTLAGVTMHAHTLMPGQFEDLSGNRIIRNRIGTNNTGGDTLDSAPPPAPPNGPEDLQTTGVLVFSAGTTVHVVISHNRIFDNHFGIWTSAVVSAAGVRTNSFFSVTVPLSLNN